ncbi:MAG: hypothetical protein HYR90_04865, partial [Candidatus Andersenbacteria bacterium]|nr:hypothetical protein [Candidatus Andersenbacteria bacterium]
MSFFRKLVKKNRTQLIVIGLGIIAFVALAVASSEYSALTRTSVLTEPRDSVSCTCFCSAEGEVHLPMCRNDQVVCTADLQKYTLTLNGPFKNYIAAADACAALNYNRGCDGFRRDPKNPSARIHDNGVLNLCTTTNIPTVTPAPTPTSTPKPTPTPTVTPTPSPEPPCVVEAGGICVKSTISSGAGKGCYVAGGSLTISLTAELTEAKSEKEFGSARLYPINFYDEEGAYIPYLIRPNFDPFAFFYGLSGRIWIPQVFGSKTYTLTGTVNEDIPRATVLRWSFDVKTGFHNENAASYVLEVPGCTQEKAVKTPTCEIRHITMTGERAEEGIESSERNQWNGNTPKTLDAEAMKQRLTQKSREFCFA